MLRVDSVVANWKERISSSNQMEPLPSARHRPGHGDTALNDFDQNLYPQGAHILELGA